MGEYQIREAVPDDAPRIIAYMKTIADEPNNGIAMSSADEFTYTDEEEREIITQSLEDDTRLFLVAEANGEIISVANARPAGGRDGFRATVGMGITVHRDWRGQGVGTAVMRRMIDWCRENPKIHRLELDVFSDNPRAIHVYEKLGFEHEGVRREVFYKEGEFKTLMLMGMLFDHDAV